MTKTFISFLLLSPFLVLGGHASPVKRTTVTPRDEDKPSAFTTSIWVPILVVGLVLIAAGSMAWSNRRIRRLILPGRPTPAAQQPVQTRRELTADELAGTINTGAANSETNVAQPAARTRRTRRPRRTPSQMSVTSLPEYNKEPGEQELVIFRGQDAEDLSLPLTEVPEPDDDEESSMQSHTRDISDASIPSPNRPLLDENNRSAPPTPSRRNSRIDSSHHALPHSDEESQGLMHQDNVPDDRGEAPPYFEVVEEELQNLPAAVSSPPQSPDINDTQTPPTGPNNPVSPTRSGFRTFFNRVQHVGAPRAMGHARGDSAGSSSTQAHDPASPSAHRPGHRATPSNASSFFRTLSRQRSRSSMGTSARLNSPSLISLNSISPPLTHTVSRTQFTYPKDGPTPEQLKMISSRESIARFGVPYGADALAFASTSMLDVTQPPPDFNTVFGASSSSLNVAGSNASHLSLHVRGDSGGAARMSSPLSQPSVDRQGTADDNSNLLSAGLSSPTDTLPSAPATGSSFASAATPSSPTTSELDPEPEFLKSDTITSKATTTYKSLAPSLVSQSGMSEFGERLSRAPSAPGSTVASSLHGRNGTGRSGSRTSVYSQLSYATAAESMATRGRRGAGSRLGSHDDEGDDGEGEGGAQQYDKTGTPILGTPIVGTPAGTPKIEFKVPAIIGSLHGKEATDATLVGTAPPTVSVSSA